MSGNQFGFGLLSGGGQNVTIRAPKAASLRSMTSAYGRVIPVVYGTNRVQANVIYYTDFNSIEHKSTENAGGKGGGGAKQTNIDYTYTVCVLFAISEGVVDLTSGQCWVGKNKGSASSFGLSAFTGTNSQSPFSYIATNHPTESLPYANTAYLAASAFDLGNNPALPNINVEVKGSFAGSFTGFYPLDANPATILNDIVTNSKNLGFSSIQGIDGLRTYCQAAEILISPAYVEAKPVREIIGNICKIANCGIFSSAGVLKVVPFCDASILGNGASYTPDLTPAYDLTENDFIPSGDETVRVIRKAQSDCYNHVKVSYQNRDNDYNDDVVEAKDQASIDIYGLRTMSEVQLPEVVNKDAARVIAQQILQRSISIKNTYEFRVSWRYARLEPMDIVTLTESNLGLVAEPVRIIEIEETEDGFYIKAEEANIGTHAAARYTTETSSGYSVDYNIDPADTNSPVIFEPPASLSGNPQLWIAASGGSNWGGCNVYVSDDDATYKLVGKISGKARHGVTVGGISNVASPDTTSSLNVNLSVSNGALAPATLQAANDLTTLCYLDGELISYRDSTLTSANNYTLAYLIRGAYGSPISSHASSSKFARLDDSIFKYDYDKKFVGRTIYLKFQSFNIYGGGIQDLGSLSHYTYTFAGAQIPNVPNLFLQQPFTGDSAKFKWGAVDGAVKYYVEVKRIVSSAYVTLRTLYTQDLQYEYTWQDSIADGGPYRAITLFVTAIAQNGQSGVAAVQAANNPVPDALSGISITGGYSLFSVSFNADTSPDVMGYQIWMSPTSGFTPSGGNLVYDGTSNSRTIFADAAGTVIPTTATTYYFRVAAYDKFGKTSLNVSSEISATSLTLAAGINANDITAAMIAAGALDMTKFASGIRPPRVVTSLPTIDGTTYKNQDLVTLTTDGKLYRAVDGSWSRAVDGADITADTITAAQIAAGAIGVNELAAGAVTADKLFVGTKGAAINSDPSCVDATAWGNTGSVYSIATITDGIFGNSVLRSSTTRNTSWPTSQIFNITAGKTYRVQCWARAVNSGAGTLYMRCYRQNSAGTELSPSGAGSVGVEGVTVPTSWTQFVGTFVAENNTAKGYLAAPMNWGGTANTAYIELQDFRIEEMLPATLIKDGAITTNKIAALAIDAGKIASDTITAAQIAANTITGNKIAAATIEGSNIAAETITAGNIAAGAITASEIAAETITTDRLIIGSVSSHSSSNTTSGSFSVSTSGSSSIATYGNFVVASNTKTYNGSALLYTVQFRMRFATKNTLPAGNYEVIFNTSDLYQDNGSGGSLSLVGAPSTWRGLMYLTPSSSYDWRGSVSIVLPNTSYTGTRRLYFDNPIMIVQVPSPSSITGGIDGSDYPFMVTTASFTEIKV